MIQREKFTCQHCNEMCFVLVEYNTTIKTPFGVLEFKKKICEACQKFLKCYSESYRTLFKEALAHMLKIRKHSQKSNWSQMK